MSDLTRCQNERARCETCQHQNQFCGRPKLTYLSTRNLRCGLSEPGFEASLAEPGGFVRHECSEGHLRPRTHLVAVEGNVGEALEELEELRRMHDRVGD